MTPYTTGHQTRFLTNLFIDMCRIAKNMDMSHCVDVFDIPNSKPCYQQLHHYQQQSKGTNSTSYPLRRYCLHTMTQTQFPYWESRNFLIQTLAKPPVSLVHNTIKFSLPTHLTIKALFTRIRF